METIGEIITGYTPWLWIALGLLLIAAETMVPGMHFAFFGLSAFVVGVGLLLTWFGFSMQLLLFGIVSLIAIGLGRPFYNRKHASDTPNLNERGLGYVGRMARVEVAISGGRGRVRLGDTVWSAQGPDMPAGSDVKITGVNGTVLIVARV